MLNRHESARQKQAGFVIKQVVPHDSDVWNSIAILHTEPTRPQKPRSRREHLRNLLSLSQGVPQETQILEPVFIVQTPQLAEQREIVLESPVRPINTPVVEFDSELDRDMGDAGKLYARELRHIKDVTFSRRFRPDRNFFERELSTIVDIVDFGFPARRRIRGNISVASDQLAS